LAIQDRLTHLVGGVVVEDLADLCLVGVREASLPGIHDDDIAPIQGTKPLDVLLEMLVAQFGPVRHRSRQVARIDLSASIDSAQLKLNHDHGERNDGHAGDREYRRDPSMDAAGWWGRHGKFLR
jgi:hypothetical protein